MTFHQDRLSALAIIYMPWTGFRIKHQGLIAILNYPIVKQTMSFMKLNHMDFRAAF